jgi:WD40 repeat protein
LAKKNKKLEEKKSVSRMFYHPAEEKILAVGSLSSTIHQFDLELNAVGEVRPRECRELDKEVGILSVGYNVSNNRLGAILTSGTLVFWEGSDGFTTQKSITLRNYGDKVFFLEQAACWVTVSSNAVNFWDLKEEVVTSTLQVPEAASILDICELPHLRALCLSIVGADQRKSLVLYHEGKRKAVIDLGSAACHSLHYHPGTRTLLPLTYTSSLAIWTVKDLQFDPQLKFVLRGHKGIVTCADSLHEAPLLVTGDDAGEIRVWELTYMRCLQSVKLARWLGGIKLIGEHLLYSDSRINLLPLERLVPPRPEKETPLYLAHQPQEKALWMFTRKDARRV